MLHEIVMVALWYNTVVVFSNFMIYGTFTAPEKSQLGSSFKPSSMYTAHLTGILQIPDVHNPIFSMVLKLVSTDLLLYFGKSISCLEVWPNNRLN
jgi:hypothetical protein